MKSQVLLVYTGGTIGMVKDNQTGLLKAFDLKTILAQIPELSFFKNQLDAISVSNPKDSADIEPVDWQDLGQLIFNNYNKYSGFVILHGTDTMVYTASALSFMFQNLTKPIILTGSQLPISDIRTDAKRNILTAIQIALLHRDSKPMINEVAIYFNDKLMRANRTIKRSSNSFTAFDSPNYPVLATSGVELTVNSFNLYCSKAKKIQFEKDFDQEVFLLKLHPGITQKQFEQLCIGINFKVLLLESFGSGTVFSHQWFQNELQKLKERKIIVINCTQCSNGFVSHEIYTSGDVLKKSGVLSAKGMTTESVLVKSMFLLGKKMTNNEFKTQFEIDLCGEIS